MLCAPLNCRHVNISSVCEDTEAAAGEVVVTARSCPRCAAEAEAGESCEVVTTDSCEDHPLQHTWHKHCHPTPEVSTDSAESTTYYIFYVALHICSKLSIS